MAESPLRGIANRVLQEMAKVAPGARTVRVRLHRARGVRLGRDVWIGYDSVLETAHPELITIEDGASIGIRVTIVAHFRETSGVVIERDAFIGPCVTILPNVVVGRGAVVTAGSVVSRSIPPMTVAQGNPAVPIAECGVALTPEVTMKEFSRRLKPLRGRSAARGAQTSDDTRSAHG
jgi:acetyltransferase-like isoleucine patch superfamily enzyme